MFYILRVQSGNFGKLNKSVRFPEVLNLAPYMRGKSDKSPQYSLYAVVVHRDRMNDTSTGHYVCYIKTSHGEWFGINDSEVCDLCIYLVCIKLLFELEHLLFLQIIIYLIGRT